jgi:hypothetical protein
MIDIFYTDIEMVVLQVVLNSVLMRVKFIH